MTRMLLALVAVQVVAIGWLLKDVRDLQRDVRQLTASSQLPSANPSYPDAWPETPQPATDNPVGTASPSLTSIRAVVRQEIESALADVRVGSFESPRPAGEIPEAESEAQYQATMDAIDNYLQLGRIDPQDMAALQQQIARLNPTHRSQARSYLAGAMTSGQLDARDQLQ